MTLMTESSGKGDWGKNYDVMGQPVGQGVKVEMKKGLSTKERMELFARLGELVRNQCECYGSEKKECDRCFDLLQLLRIHKETVGVEFMILRRKEEERLVGEKGGHNAAR